MHAYCFDLFNHLRPYKYVDEGCCNDKRPKGQLRFKIFFIAPKNKASQYGAAQGRDN